MTVEQLEKKLNQKYKEYLEHLDIFDYPEREALELKLIKVKDEHRGSGVGTEIMKEIIGYADQNNLTIVLSVSEIKTNKLIKWYKNFGFIPNKGRNKDFRFISRMIRYPHGLTRSKWIDKQKLAVSSLPDDMTQEDIEMAFDLGLISRQEATEMFESNLVVPKLVAELYKYIINHRNYSREKISRLILDFGHSPSYKGKAYRLWNSENYHEVWHSYTKDKSIHKGQEGEIEEIRIKDEDLLADVEQLLNELEDEIQSYPNFIESKDLNLRLIEEMKENDGREKELLVLSDTVS